MRRLVVGVTLGMLACGGGRPWEMKGAPKPPPDVQFRTGVEVGDDVFIWNCIQGEHVIIAQRSSAFCGTSAPRMERGPCGTKLPLEERMSAYRHPDDVPDGMRWPGSPPPKPEELSGLDAGPDAGASDAKAP